MADSIFKQIGSVVGTAISETNTKVDAMFSISGTDTLANQNILPANATVSLGSAANPFADIFISESSLYVNGTKVISEDTGTIVFSADPDQNVQIQTSGSGDIEFYPTGTGVLQMKGTVSILAGTNLTSSDGQPISCTVGFGDLTVQNLTVAGTSTTVNTEILSVADNIITLNSGVSGTPTINGGIEIERGDENNSKIIFNESTDKWQFTNDGSTYEDIGSDVGTYAEFEAALTAAMA